MLLDTLYVISETTTKKTKITTTTTTTKTTLLLRSHRKGDTLHYESKNMPLYIHL